MSDLDSTEFGRALLASAGIVTVVLAGGNFPSRDLLPVAGLSQQW